MRSAFSRAKTDTVPLITASSGRNPTQLIR